MSLPKSKVLRSGKPSKFRSLQIRYAVMKNSRDHWKMLYKGLRRVVQSKTKQIGSSSADFVKVPKWKSRWERLVSKLWMKK